ncbi:MAG: tetratricopeptide repeat protein [Candidatus Aminicenantes bacterium]|nr:tetratricopeptide repeat protein [Candidatus Aminicenantes bacterium]
MKRKKISLILSLCLGFVLILAAADPLPKPQSKDALKKMEKAEKAIKNKEFDVAPALYQEVIVLEPTYAPVYFTSAQLQRAKSDYDAALANYEKAIAIDPNFALARNEYIRTLLILGQKAVEVRDLKKAAAYYEKIMNCPNIDATHPKELQHAAYQLGTIAYNLQDFNKSIAAFQRFLAIPEIEKTSPGNSILAVYMLGINYSRLNQPEQANPFLEKFIAAPQNETTTPWLPLSYYLLANNNYLSLDKQIARIKENKSADALATFDQIAAAAKASTGIQPNLLKAIELKPDLEDAFVKLGNYFFYCQDFDNALKTYNDLIAKFPAAPDIATYKSFMQNIEKERDALKALKSKKKTK